MHILSVYIFIQFIYFFYFKELNPVMIRHWIVLFTFSVLQVLLINNRTEELLAFELKLFHIFYRMETVLSVGASAGQEYPAECFINGCEDTLYQHVKGPCKGFNTK